MNLIAKEDEIHGLVENVGDISLLSTSKKANDEIETLIEFNSQVDKRGEIYNYIKQQDWVLLEMHRDKISLEDVFRNLTIEEGGE